MSDENELHVRKAAYDDLPAIGQIFASSSDELVWGVQERTVRLLLRRDVSQPNLYSLLTLEAAAQISAELAIDLGCGSGALGIGYAAARFETPEVRCLDIDPAAVGLARENVAINRLGQRVTVFESDWLQDAEDLARCDLIMSSPPHTPCSPEIYAEVREIDSSLARSSFGGPDGLTHIRSILVQALVHCPAATIVMAVGAYVVPGLERLALQTGFEFAVSSRVIARLSVMAERIRPYVETTLDYTFPQVGGRTAAEIAVVRFTPRQRVAST